MDKIYKEEKQSLNNKNNNKGETITVSKKKRKFEESMEDILKDPDNKLSKGMTGLDVKSDSEYASEGEDSNPIDEEESGSEDYVEKDITDFKKKEKKVTNKKINIWDEKTNKLGKDEFLDFDNEAYEMLHRARPEWPCMSIDFVIPENFYPPVKDFYPSPNKILQSKDVFPYSCYMIAGGMTSGYDGFLYLMKWYNMKKTKYDDDPDMSIDDSQKSDNNSENDQPSMRFEKVKVSGNINRIKALKNSYLSAYWSDDGSVSIVDLRPLINEIETSKGTGIENDELLKPTNKKKKVNSNKIILKTFKRKLEGFALDWSSHNDYSLAAGGIDKILELYCPSDEGCSDFVLKGSLSKAHEDSIEDIVFSPFDKEILATCSVDRTIKLWDQRIMTGPAMVIKNAHKSDVNVLAFNPHGYGFDKNGKPKNLLLASGGDDGAIRVWDMRRTSSTDYLDNIEWHKGPITSISWDPYDDTQLAAASEDNSLSIWDFGVEPDDQQLFDFSSKKIPEQLVFLHQGQENIKDFKFHPIYKNFLVTTAENGINVLKPNFEDDGDDEEEDEEEEDKDMDIED